MLDRTLFSTDHEAFRESYRKFCEREIAPFHEAWEEQGYVDREVWRKAGANGFLCMTMPEAYGGAGADRLYSVIELETNAAGGYSGIDFGLHNDIVAPYIERYGTEAQKQKYLTAMARGEMIGAIAMSEPGVGSDLQAIKTTAIKQPDGSYILNGSKTFITNGWHSDLLIVVAKTDPSTGAKGTSLMLVERGMKGFEKGKRLKKLGLKAQDTAELFFDNVHLPPDGVLGGPSMEGKGFICLMQELPFERVFVDRCLELALPGKLDTATASMAKLTCSELQGKVVDECLQLHGGYGFMLEYQVARPYADARVTRICGGTSEIMKEVIARSMGLGR